MPNHLSRKSFFRSVMLLLSLGTVFTQVRGSLSPMHMGLHNVGNVISSHHITMKDLLTAFALLASHPKTLALSETLGTLLARVSLID